VVSSAPSTVVPAFSAFLISVLSAVGSATFKYSAGIFEISVMFTDSDAECYYDKENLTLTAEKTEVQVALYFAAEQEGRNLVVQGKEYV